MKTQQTVPSQTHDHPTFLTILRAFGAGEHLACVECEATATRLFYLITTAGGFLWGSVLCEPHYAEACREVDARLTHPIREIRTLREASDN
jgi:hypothetical protein